MLTNWNDQFQTLGIPTRKNELWRNSQVKNFINFDSSSKANIIADNLKINSLPILPSFMQGDSLFFNGTKWETTSSSLKINAEVEKELLLSFQKPLQKKQLHLQDGSYAWYKNKSTCCSVELLQSKILVIYIPHLSDQSILPELYLNIAESITDLTIYEVHFALNIELESENTLYSINIFNRNTHLHYHRFHLGDSLKSLSWFQLNNYSLFYGHFWKNKQNSQKEFVSLNNQQELATVNFKVIANLKGNAHCDLTTQMNHTAKQTSSVQLLKCILADEAQASLTGKIFIDKFCPQSSAHFKSKHTLLSPKAHIHSQPQLEIYTDDVECAHGSSTGSLQEEELFYLISRGIAPLQAKKMLLGAFIVDEILSLPTVEEQAFFKELVL